MSEIESDSVGSCSYSETEYPISSGNDEPLDLVNNECVRPHKDMLVRNEGTFDLNDLAQWSVENNVSQVALNSLLKLLKCHECFKHFPCDSRTVLCTPKSYDVKSVLPGKYVHFGIGKQVSKLLESNCNFVGENVELAVNVDGLPISKSSNSTFWPILGSVVPLNSVFMIGLYHGYEKPSNPNEYLQDFVEEVKQLAVSGINVNDKILKFCLKSIICDAPAKSFILGIKGHAGFDSCTKCKIKGTYSNRRVCFPDLISEKRTHEEFRNRTHQDYQIKYTILTEMPNFDFVSNVPYDYMHLVCLGVTRKLLQAWVKGDLPNRLQSRDVSLNF